MNRPLLVVIGPTGSGKSALAVELARKFSGEVVSCDSVQVYRYLDIGAAKLSKSEQQGIPHHLVDIIEPDQLFTAGDFLSLGRASLQEIQARHRLPIVAGGTGLYLKALLEGLFEGPRRSESFRNRLQELAARKGSDYLHRLLRRLDRISAGRIAPKDHAKVIRALEVCFLTSQPLSRHLLQGRDPIKGFDVLKVGLNPARTLLYESIDRRVEKMFADGLRDEVAALLARGFGEHVKPLQSLGYAQTIRHLKGELSLEAAIAATQSETRHYAKRQLTWFRREKDVVWFNGFGSQPEIHSAVVERVRSFLRHSGSSGELLLEPAESSRPQPDSDGDC